ncbi:MAG TPA: hypothetical protein PLG90_04975 [Ignavibacteria bacterium]|nr:hypothetical protein [Ignavibacteria bacterium]
MKKTFLIAICLVITNICYPQKNNILTVNRTASIESAFTVPKNTLQLELGISYSIKNNLQFDISGGKKLNKEYDEFYAGAGVTCRLQK